MKTKKYITASVIAFMILCLVQINIQARKIDTKISAVNISGTWSGNCSDETGPGKMTLSLNQNGNNVTGDAILTDNMTAMSLKGKVQGSVNGNIFSGTISLDDLCNSKIKFQANIGDNRLTGQYSGYNDCGSGIKNGRLSLQRGEDNTTTGNNVNLSLPTEEKIKADLIGQKAMTQYGMWEFGSLNEIKKFNIKDKKITNGLLEYTIEMKLSDGQIVHVATTTVIYKIENGSWKIYGVNFRRFY